MDTVEVKVEELDGEVLIGVHNRLPATWYPNAIGEEALKSAMRERIRKAFGPTVRVPAELVREVE